MATASSRMEVSDQEKDPVVSRAIVDSKYIDGEKVPGLDPFVVYEHARRKDLEYSITEDGGIQVFYNPEYPDDNPWYETWGFSIRIEVLEDKDSYIEVRYSPKVENHKNGERIWKDIVDTLEDRTTRYHEDIKGELHG